MGVRNNQYPINKVTSEAYDKVGNYDDHCELEHVFVTLVNYGQYDLWSGTPILSCHFLNVHKYRALQCFTHMSSIAM